MKHRIRKHWGVIGSAALTMVSALIVAAYLILPAMWQWNDAAGRVRTRGIVQIDTEPGDVDQQLADRLRNATTSNQAAPIIITYHDINPTQSEYSVSPEAFATQMQMLHDAGWTTLTVGQLDDWQHGKPLPPHSVMITFDDGTSGVWRYADPVLKRFGMHATAFIITGFVGTHAPYYMTWDQLADLNNSGRWDLEAHTHLGHVQIAGDANGTKGAFLSTPMYLPEQHRAETTAEFHARTLGDLTECKRQFALHGLPEPIFFAYPFSAHEADEVQNQVLSLFHGAMLDDAHLIQVTSTEDAARGLIRRMDVTWDLSLDGLVRKIELASPLDPAGTAPFLDRGSWTDSDQQPTSAMTLDPVLGDRMTVDPGPGASTSVQYARLRTTMWSSYAVSADFLFDGDGTTTGISVFVGNIKHEVVVTLSRSHYSVSFGDSDQDIASGDLPKMAVYHLDITATTRAVSVSINGQQLPPVVMPPDVKTEPREVAGGIGFNSRRDSASSPPSVVANLSVTTLGEK